MKKYYIYFLVFSFNYLLSQPVSQTFTTAGAATYTIPENYKATIKVEVIGAGGGTSGYGGGALGAKNGGGGGGYAQYTYADVPAGSYNLYVAALPSGGVARGDTSWFDGPAGITRLNGYGGGRGTTSATAAGIGVGGSAAGPAGAIIRAGGNGGSKYQVGLDSLGGGGGAAGSAAGAGANGANAVAGTPGVGGTGGEGDGGNGGSTGSFGFKGTAPGGGSGGGGGRRATPVDPPFGAIDGSRGEVRITVESFMILPITLIDFSATMDENVQLVWQTASETNNEYFEIQKSTEGEIFGKIGKVLGAGNSTELKSYTYFDESPFNGINYYRLKQVDYDGTASYSKVVSLEYRIQKNSQLSIFPNKVEKGQFINVIIPKSLAGNDIEIFDISGKKIDNITPRNLETNVTIDTNNFEKGIYIAKIGSSKSENLSARFVIY